MFPITRSRRLRSSKNIRSMVKETTLSVNDFIYPLFVCEGKSIRHEVPSMPGIYNLSVDEVIKEAKEAEARRIEEAKRAKAAKKAQPKPKKQKTKGSKNDTLEKLRSFLAATEPETIEFLLSFWHAQSQGVTYKELREAYLSGGITDKQFKDWQKEYAELITSTLASKWQHAADEAAAEVAAKYPHFVYEPSISASMDYIRQHSAELVTNLAQEQKDAINALIAQYA